MTCTHDVVEQQCAIADGMCPICLAAQLAAQPKASEEVERLRGLLSNAKAVMLSAGLPRRDIDDPAMMLEFFKEIDDAIGQGSHGERFAGKGGMNANGF